MTALQTHLSLGVFCLVCAGFQPWRMPPFGQVWFTIILHPFFIFFKRLRGVSGGRPRGLFGAIDQRSWGGVLTFPGDDEKTFICRSIWIAGAAVNLVRVALILVI